MTAIFRLQNNNTSSVKDSDDWSKINNDYIEEVGTRRLFLFMIGGSGASIIKPFLHFFINQYRKSQYILTPIFIDRSFNSNIVSEGIVSISRFKKYCQYALEEDVVSSPMFFCEEDTEQLWEKTKLSDILYSITKKDLVYMSLSYCIEDNVRIKNVIINLIRENNCCCPIYKCAFLPYFILGNNLDTVDIDAQLSNDISKKTLKSALANESLGKKEYIYYVGLSKQSLYKYSDFQRNPFNIVSLIASYSILKSAFDRPSEENACYSYGINTTDRELHPSDVIIESQFRQELIYADMTFLLWYFLRDTKNPIIMQISSDCYNYIREYLLESILMINDLGDLTIHKSFTMYLRNYDTFNVKKISANFKKKILFMNSHWSDVDLCKAILQNINKSHLVNENMIACEMLKSIKTFIGSYYDQIDCLYY